jgi:hypothetical protein
VSSVVEEILDKVIQKSNEYQDIDIIDLIDDLRDEAPEQP